MKIEYEPVSAVYVAFQSVGKKRFCVAYAPTRKDAMQCLAKLVYELLTDT